MCVSEGLKAAYIEPQGIPEICPLAATCAYGLQKMLSYWSAGLLHVQRSYTCTSSINLLLP